MTTDKLMEHIVEQTGGKIIKNEINGVESEVVVGSSITFPSFMTPHNRRERFWNSWRKHYEEHQMDSK